MYLVCRIQGRKPKVTLMLSSIERLVGDRNVSIENEILGMLSPTDKVRFLVTTGRMDANPVLPP